MKVARRLLLRLKGMFTRTRAQQDFDAELQSHLEMHIEDAMRSGLTEAEARRQAHLQLGGLAQTRELYLEQSGVPILENLARDIAYSFRLLRKSPTFTSVAILSLALGIGANTAMFTLINAVMLRPLPYPQPQRLMHTVRDISLPEYETLRGQSSLFASVAGRQGGPERRIDFQGHTEWIPTALITPAYFHTLQVPLAQGQEFVPNSAPRSVILSHALASRLATHPSETLNNIVSLDGEPFTVTGVTSENLWLPESADAFIPLRATGTIGDLGANTQVLARLTHDPATTNLQYNGIALTGLQQYFAGDVRTRLLLFLAAVGFVLLIACFNLAGLLLARLSARRREISVRLALGSGRARLLQQLLIENLILCALGGAAGVLAAYWILDSFVALLPFRLTTAAPIAIDGNVLLFACALTFLSGVLVSLAPGWMFASLNLQHALRQSTPGSGDRTRLRSALVVVEVAAATALLAGAAMLLESLYHLNRRPLGFVPEGLLTFYAPPERGLDQARKQNRIEMFRQQLALIPGVRSVAVANVLPLTGKNNFPAQRSGRPDQSIGGMEIRIVTPNYFETMRTRLLSGRGFGPHDRDQSTPVVLINEALARQWWSGASPIGNRIDVGSFKGKPLVTEATREVIGVVADMQTILRGEPARPTLFLPIDQARWYSGGVHFVLRAASPDALSETVRRSILQLAPGQRIQRMQTMDRILAATTANPRFDATIIGSFACSALILAMLGVYGVLAYSVARRTSEIGIRMALGASPHEVLRLILRQGLTLVAIGLAIGIPAPLFLARNVPALTAVALLLSAVGFLASLLPARRAMRIDPLSALRVE